MIPLLSYVFDYFTRIYTDLLSSGNQAAVEFMPFVCSLAYLVFVLQTTQEQKLRSQLEQTQNSLNLQVAQAVREIDALRESQRKASTYRHDLRHHLQYISACIENGRAEAAQEYIHSVCAEIEASKVNVYCENEAANLILSALACAASAPLWSSMAACTAFRSSRTSLCCASLCKRSIQCILWATRANCTSRHCFCAIVSSDGSTAA